MQKEAIERHARSKVEAEMNAIIFKFNVELRDLKRQKETADNLYLEKDFLLTKYSHIIMKQELDTYDCNLDCLTNLNFEINEETQDKAKMQLKL